MERKMHVLKLLTYYCDDVYTGRKNFVVRYNDRGFQAGDIITFVPIYPDGISCSHPVQDAVFQITYVYSGLGVKDGYVVLGIRKQTSYKKREKK